MINAFQMIEAVVQARDTRKFSAQRKRPHVASHAMTGPAPRETQHRQRQIDAHRSEPALREEIDRQSCSARDIEMCFLLCRKPIEDSCQDPADSAKETLAERLIVRVRERAVGLAQWRIA